MELRKQEKWPYLPDDIINYIIEFIDNGYDSKMFMCHPCKSRIHRSWLSKLTLECVSNEHWRLTNEPSYIVCIRCIIIKPSVTFFTEDELLDDLANDGVKEQIQKQKKDWNKKLLHIMFNKPVIKRYIVSGCIRSNTSDITSAHATQVIISIPIAMKYCPQCLVSSQLEH